MDQKKIDVADMTASWLEAVAKGEAEGFSRHFVPDILEALKASQEREAALVKEQEAARLWREEHRDCAIKYGATITALKAELAEAKDNLARAQQNNRIVRMVDELAGPEQAKMTEAVLQAVDRAEKAESGLFQMQEAAKDLASQLKKAEAEVSRLSLCLRKSDESHLKALERADALARAVAAKDEALRGALPYVEHATQFLKYQRPGTEFYPNKEGAEACISRVNAALSPTPPSTEASGDATVQTVINLLTKDRPVCPKDLSESGKYELIIEAAVDLLRGIASPAQEQGTKDAPPAAKQPCQSCGGTDHEYCTNIAPAPSQAESAEPRKVCEPGSMGRPCEKYPFCDCPDDDEPTPTAGEEGL